jgi:chromosome segregation ATPase
MDDSPQPSPSGSGLPGWALALFGLLLAAILVVGGATLYLVAQIDDRNAQVEQTAKTVKATKALVDVVAARQLERKDVPARVEAAAEELQTLLTETQKAIDATNEAVAATNQTLAATNALLDQAQAAATKAQQSTAKLQSRVDDLRQSQQELSHSLDQRLAKIESGLAAIETRLDTLGSR